LDARKVERSRVGAEPSVCAAVAEITGGPKGMMQGTRGICYTSFYFILNPKINHIVLLDELSPGRKCFVLKTQKVISKCHRTRVNSVSKLISSSMNCLCSE